MGNAHGNEAGNAFGIATRNGWRNSADGYLHIGVTGTRYALTAPQLAWLAQLPGTVLGPANVLHQGACTGGDYATTLEAFKRGAVIESHPPLNKRFRQPEEGYRARVVHPEKDYHSRDRDVVHASAWLIGLPNSARRPHSGTWYTIDYALSVGIPVVVCHPRGEVELLTPTGVREP